MRQIIITEFMDEPAVQSLRQQFEVIYDPRLVDEPQRLQSLLPQADALIVRNRTQVNASLLQHAPRVRVVGRLGVGLDNIDLKACAEKSIQVIPATGANARAVAEYVIGAAFYLMRGSFGASQEVAQGSWPRLTLSNGKEIYGKTLGLIGFGFIGRLTADLARPLGLETIAFDPMLKADDPAFEKHHTRCVQTLEDLLQSSDIVSLHVPLTPQTENLIDGRRIKQMKPGAILINTARGSIVDEAALINALQSKQLGGAALDVFETEPLAQGAMPGGLSNLILTPHIAGLTQESNERVSSLIATRVAGALS